MFGLFGKKKTSKKPVRREKDPVRYEQEKEISQSGDKKKRLTLARDSKTHQQILYYLAEHDPDADVRKAVAGNVSTPLQASTLLAGDADMDVRYALAQRLVHLLPDMEAERQSQLYAFAVQALGMLALDEVLKVRRALSSTLKDYAQAPPQVVGQLARDVEKEISEPILRFCVALSDEDLLDILKGHPASWTVQAIAAREKVSEQVSEAVIETDDRPAGAILINNEGALIAQRTLDVIIQKAQAYPEWQKPMAVRKSLSPEMAHRLAEYADASVRDILLRRKDFDSQAVEDIASIFRRRLSYAKNEQTTEDPAARLRELEEAGMLTEETLSDTLGMRDRALACAIIARMAKTNVPMVEKILDMKAPKPIVALSWQAGLSMRMALRLQQEVAKVPSKELIYPRGGTDYPLSKEELKWQLEFLGLKTA